MTPTKRLALLLALAGLVGCTSAGPAGTGSPAPLASIAATPTAEITPSPEPSAPVVTVTPIAGAPDSGVTVKLVIDNVRWSVGSIVAPAGKTWHVEIDNHDGLTEQHNFVVASGPPSRSASTRARRSRPERSPSTSRRCRPAPISSSVRRIRRS